MKAHFLIKLVQSYRYRFYNIDFEFNNQLYKHLRITYNKFKFSIATKNVNVKNFEIVNKFVMIITIITLIAITSFIIMIFHISKVIITFHASKVVYLNVINVIIKGYVFREHRFIIILMMFILIE